MARYAVLQILVYNAKPSEPPLPYMDMLPLYHNNDHVALVYGDYSNNHGIQFIEKILVLSSI